MAFLNRVILIGNSTKDAEVRQTGTGKQVCNFAIATNEYWKSPSGEQMSESEFHYITAWDRLAEIAVKFVKTGRKIYIEGRKRTTKFPKDGVEVERVEIIAHKIMTLDKAPSEEYAKPYQGEYNGNF
tara:strand:- start:4098 stop:4478 length:381 start_codon:yes stop_codon:yes gene_type:complete